MNTTLDNTDQELITERTALWDAKTGPRVGDYVRMLDGSLLRFTHDWGDSMQTTVGPSHPCNGDSSFYLGNGYCEFSGSLAPGIPADTIQETTETRPGSVWIFHHGEARAHNAVYATVSCRVYQVTP